MFSSNFISEKQFQEYLKTFDSIENNPESKDDAEQKRQAKEALYQQINNKGFVYHLTADEYDANGKAKNISIDFHYTAKLQEIVITQHRQILDTISFDVMDNTIAGSISADTQQKLGEHYSTALNVISSFLQEYIGAKEFLRLPSKVNVPEGFIAAAEKTDYTRTRFAGKEWHDELKGILLQYENKTKRKLAKDDVSIIDALDKTKFVVGQKRVAEALDGEKAYEKLLSFIDDNANYSPEKMQTYTSDKIEGMRARFTNANMTPIVLLHPTDNSIIGSIRILKLNKDNAYFSDETIANNAILEKVLPLEMFYSEEERARFVLGYLLFKALKVANCDNIFILANPNCVRRYSSLGLKKFLGLADENLYLCFDKQKPLLSLIKGAVSYAHAQEILLAKQRENRTANTNIDPNKQIKNTLNLAPKR